MGEGRFWEVLLEFAACTCLEGEIAVYNRWILVVELLIYTYTKIILVQCPDPMLASKIDQTLGCLAPKTYLS